MHKSMAVNADPSYRYHAYVYKGPTLLYKYSDIDPYTAKVDDYDNFTYCVGGNIYYYNGTKLSSTLNDVKMCTGTNLDKDIGYLINGTDLYRIANTSIALVDNTRHWTFISGVNDATSNKHVYAVGIADGQLYCVTPSYKVVQLSAATNWVDCTYTYLNGEYSRYGVAINNLGEAYAITAASSTGLRKLSISGKAYYCSKFYSGYYGGSTSAVIVTTTNSYRYYTGSRSSNITVPESMPRVVKFATESRHSSNHRDLNFGIAANGRVCNYFWNTVTYRSTDTDWIDVSGTHYSSDYGIAIRQGIKLAYILPNMTTIALPYEPIACSGTYYAGTNQRWMVVMRELL